MIKLWDIIKEIYEQEESENIIDFPDQNFTVALDPNQKKMIFAPEEDSVLPSKLRTLIQMIRQEFNVSNVKSLEDEGDYDSGDDSEMRGSFQMEFDPRENFDEAVRFIQQQADETL